VCFSAFSVVAVTGFDAIETWLGFFYFDYPNKVSMDSSDGLDCGFYYFFVNKGAGARVDT
jgi:hypothetical protein